MVLLKQKVFLIRTFCKLFTFHYGSSQTKVDMQTPACDCEVTFHYGSSQTSDFKNAYSIELDLHSTMVLLKLSCHCIFPFLATFTFHYGSSQTLHY